MGTRMSSSTVTAGKGTTDTPTGICDPKVGQTGVRREGREGQGRTMVWDAWLHNGGRTGRDRWTTQWNWLGLLHPGTVGDLDL